MKRSSIIYFFFVVVNISIAQNDCWVKSTDLNDSYLKILKANDNKYYCSASNIWGNSVKIHIYESDDLLNWEPTNIEFPSRFNIVFNRDSEGNLYAGTQDHGVYISRDNGMAWEPKVATCAGCGSLSFEEDSNGVIYIGTGGALKGYYVSFDKGESWVNPYISANITDIEASSKTGNVFFTNINNILLISDNQGLDYHVFDDLNVLNKTLIVREINNEMFVFTTIGEIYKLSEDEQSSELYAKIPLQHIPRPYFNDVVYLESVWYVTIDNNGVFRSYDNGLSWEMIDCGLSGTVNYLFLDNFKIAATTTDGIYVLEECSGLIVGHPQTDTFQLSTNAFFTIETQLNPTAYQWQIFNGTDFESLSENGQYAGTNSEVLLINGLTLDNHGQQYRCILTFGNCTSISDVANLFVSQTLSSNNMISDHNITISPNPAYEFLEIKSELVKKRTYQIFTINGIMVTSGILRGKNVRVDLTNIREGAYILFVEGENNPLKFLKIK